MRSKVYAKNSSKVATAQLNNEKYYSNEVSDKVENVPKIKTVAKLADSQSSQSNHY